MQNRSTDKAKAAMDAAHGLLAQKPDKRARHPWLSPPMTATAGRGMAARINNATARWLTLLQNPMASGVGINDGDSGGAAF